MCCQILDLSVLYLFFSTSIVFLIKFFVRLFSELMILVSTDHVTNHLTCCNTSRFNLKNQNCWKCFYFSSDTFFFNVSRFGSYHLKFPTKHSWSFTKNVLLNQTFPSLFIPIISSFVYKEMIGIFLHRIIV